MMFVIVGAFVVKSVSPSWSEWVRFRILRYVQGHSESTTTPSSPGISSPPLRILTDDPLNASPIGSSRLPRVRDRNASVIAINDRLFSRAREPMTLIRVERIRDWDSILVHRRHDFIRLSLLDSGIVGAVTEKKRFFEHGSTGNARSAFACPLRCRCRPSECGRPIPP